MIYSKINSGKQFTREYGKHLVKHLAIAIPRSIALLPKPSPTMYFEAVHSEYAQGRVYWLVVHLENLYAPSRYWFECANL
jgi:hypothetical protein